MERLELLAGLGLEGMSLAYRQIDNMRHEDLFHRLKMRFTGWDPVRVERAKRGNKSGSGDHKIVFSCMFCKDETSYFQDTVARWLCRPSATGPSCSTCKDRISTLRKKHPADEYSNDGGPSYRQMRVGTVRRGPVASIERMVNPGVYASNNYDRGMRTGDDAGTRGKPATLDDEERASVALAAATARSRGAR